MKPFQRSPCAVCGQFLIEHCGDSKDVRCGEHKDWKRPKVPPPAPPFMRIGDKGETVNPKTSERIPPPTTEGHRRRKVVCEHCIFIWGMAAGIWLGIALQSLR